MPKIAKSKQLRFRIEEDLEEAIQQIAILRKESVPDVCRRLLKEGVEREFADRSEDYMLRLVRQTVRDVQKPMEERIAKIASKIAMAAATTMYMNFQLIDEAGYDPHELYEMAYKRSISFVRAKIMNDRTQFEAVDMDE